METRLGYDGLYQNRQVHVITDLQTNSRQIHKITSRLRKCGSAQPLEVSEVSLACDVVKFVPLF